jgi:hypothetical protein
MWIDVIDDINNNYNHTVNRGIGEERKEIDSFLENQLIQKKKDETIKILSKREEKNW